MEDKILEALLPSFSALLKSHLKGLIPLGKHKESLLITDTHYLEYEIPNPENLNVPFFSLKPTNEIKQELELEYSDVSTLRIETLDALFGVSIKEELSKECKVEFLQTWLWDISPFNSEKKKAGTSHRVIALKLTT